MPKFEVVSTKLNDWIKLPQRSDEGSAGYDFYAPTEIVVDPMKSVVVFTGVKASMGMDEVLLLFIRSSMAVKHKVILMNQVGVIDASYYNNQDNEGEIGICLLNTSNRPVKINKGDRIAQGIFVHYVTTDYDEVIHDERTGGFGSSGE